MCISNLPAGRAPSNRQRAQALESRRWRERQPLRVQVWVQARRAEPALRPQVGEWAPGPGRELERETGPGQQRRLGQGWRRERERRRSSEIFQVPSEEAGPDRKGMVVPPQAEVRAWAVPPQAASGWQASGPVRVQGARRFAPVRLGLLVLRKGSRPDRGGESASGSTSDSSRHVAYPGLPATPGQGNCDVSRETIAPNVRYRAIPAWQRA
jgi:hypothetical protein